MNWGLVISLFQGLRYLKNKQIFLFLVLDCKYRKKNLAAINWEYINHLGLFQSERTFTRFI